jgi:prophage tail gpP-like protein
VDNTLSPAIPMPKLPATVKQIIEKVLQFYGMTNIKVIDPYNLSPIKEVIAVEIGQGAEDLIQQYASKRNVLITTDNDGNIIFQRAGTDIYKTVLTRNKKDYQVIKGSDMTFDNTKRFHEYRVSDQANPMSNYYAGNQTTSKQNSDVSASKIDDEIRKTRIYYLSSDDTSEDDDVKKRVEWEGNFRRAQSVVYECDVVGFKPLLDDGIWHPNKLVRVDDVESNITNITLLISSVMFKKDNNGGSITHLKCVPQDSFTLQLNKPKKQKSDELNFGKYYVKDLNSGVS